MRTKVVHDRLEQAERTSGELLPEEISERVAIEMERGTLDRNDPPARVPVLAEPEPDTTDEDDHA